MSQSFKLSVLRTLKPLGIYRESYLENFTIFKYRSSLSKLRCSAHTLRIEKGRHVNELMADRVCTLCQLDNIHLLEDEYHFLLCCPYYYTPRETYLPYCIVDEPTYELFIALLMNESTDIQRHVAAYVNQDGKKLRNEIV